MTEANEHTQEQQQLQDPQPQPQLTEVEVPAGGGQFYGTGRRKRSVARVFLRPGPGEMVVNGRPLQQYFPDRSLGTVVQQPLQAVELLGKFDMKATAAGGGPAGQAGAIRLGIARALLEYDVDLRKKLKKLGFLTRDPRIRERKKYGQPGARKRFQYSKR